jgi:hypothetical protein
MPERTFKRRGAKVYRYDSKKAQALIFGAQETMMWAYGVWGENLFKAEGVEMSLKSARRKANAALDKVEGAEPPPERKP